MRLHLCCGDRYLDGYVNCDYDGLTLGEIKEGELQKITLSNYYSKAEIGKKQPTIVDQKFNILEKWPFEDESAEEIVMISAIEHFTQEEAQFILSEVKRVMKIGGQWKLDFPDISATIRDYYTKDPEFCMRLIYCNHKDKYSIHHWGYTFESFKKFVGENWKLDADIIVKHSYPMIGVVCTKKS